MKLIGVDKINSVVEAGNFLAVFALSRRPMELSSTQGESNGDTEGNWQQS